jgi:hypothetical protein
MEQTKNAYKPLVGKPKWNKYYSYWIHSRQVHWKSTDIPEGYFAGSTCYLVHACFFLRLSSTLKTEAKCCSETSADFQWLHGVISKHISSSKQTLWELQNLQTERDYWEELHLGDRIILKWIFEE